MWLDRLPFICPTWQGAASSAVRGLGVRVGVAVGGGWRVGTGVDVGTSMTSSTAAASTISSATDGTSVAGDAGIAVGDGIERRAAGPGGSPRGADVDETAGVAVITRTTVSTRGVQAHSIPMSASRPNSPFMRCIKAVHRRSRNGSDPVDGSLDVITHLYEDDRAIAGCS